MRYVGLIVSISLALIIPTNGKAQDLSAAIHYTSCPMQYGGRDFLTKTPPGTIGLVGSNGCNAPQLLTGTHVYLLQTQIYWGVNNPCVRIVVNHRGFGLSNQASY